MIITKWCSVCNAAPSEGILTVILKGEEHPIDLNACQRCVDSIPEEDWMTNGGNHEHD